MIKKTNASGSLCRLQRKHFFSLLVLELAAVRGVFSWEYWCGSLLDMRVELENNVHAGDAPSMVQSNFLYIS